MTKNISALQNRYTCYDKNLLSDSARRASKVLVIPFKEEILYKKKEREGKKRDESNENPVITSLLCSYHGAWVT